MASPLALHDMVNLNIVTGPLSPHFKNCLIHTLRLNSVSEFDYTKLSSPAVVGTAQDLRKRRHNYAHTERRPQSWKHEADQMRYLSCILNIVTLAFLTQSVSSHQTYGWLRQKFVFNNEAGTKFQLHSQLVIFDAAKNDEDVPNTSEVVQLRLEMEYFVSINTIEYFLPTFWLRRSIDGSTRAWFHCWYCGLTENFVPFNCPGLESCSKNMMDVYVDATQDGRNVQWLLRQDGRYLQHSSKPAVCTPENVQPHETCERKEPGTVLEFLSEGLNTTKPLSSATRARQLPQITYAEITGYNHPAFVLSTGERYQFRFITSDSIFKHGMTLGTLTSPFQLELWLCLGATTLILAVLLARLTGFSFLRCGLNVVHLASTMLEQPVQLLQYRPGTSLLSLRACRVTMGTWLLCILAIGMTYKAMLKSTYMLEPKFETKLEYLKDLQGFTLYFLHAISSETTPRSRQSLESHMAMCTKLRKVYEERYGIGFDELDCEAEFYTTTCDAWLHYLEGVRNLSFCSAVQTHITLYSIAREKKCKGIIVDLMFTGKESERLFSYTHDGENSHCLCDHHRLIKRLMQHVRVHDEAELESLLMNGLSHPRTALVVPQQSFEKTWEQVRKVMKTTRKKFASNIQTKNDPVLSISPKYKISSGFGIEGKNVLLWRAKVLMESGLQKLWKSREVVGQRRAKKFNGMTGKYSSFIPLSLSNSDFIIVFHVYMYCILFAIIASVLFECRKKLISTLNVWTA